jgi:hypothetical protein
VTVVNSPDTTTLAKPPLPLQPTPLKTDASPGTFVLNGASTTFMRGQISNWAAYDSNAVLRSDGADGINALPQVAGVPAGTALFVCIDIDFSMVCMCADVGQCCRNFTEGLVIRVRVQRPTRQPPDIEEAFRVAELIGGEIVECRVHDPIVDAF